MARRRSKKKSSNKLLKTAILLILFIGLWFIYNHTDIPARIQNALRPHKPTTVQTVPEPEVTPPKQQTGGLPAPEPVVTPPSTKNVTYTIKNPQFDNLSYGIPGVADSIVEREGYALGYIEKHEQPAWVQYIMTADEVSRRAAKRGDDFRQIRRSRPARLPRRTTPEAAMIGAILLRPPTCLSPGKRCRKVSI